MLLHSQAISSHIALHFLVYRGLSLQIARAPASVLEKAPEPLQCAGRGQIRQKMTRHAHSCGQRGRATFVVEKLYEMGTLFHGLWSGSVEQPPGLVLLGGNG